MIDPISQSLAYVTLAKDAANFDRGAMDSLSWHRAENRKMIYQHLPEQLRLISDSIEHITVNPKNLFKTFMLSTSYVYPTARSLYPDTVYINANSASTRAFVQRLIDAAMIEHLAAMNPNSAGMDRRNRVTILTGDRGSGKTYFLNHLYSSYAAAFDRSDAVWVRINISRERGFDDDLTAWYQAQAAKILLRFYERTSFHATAADQRKIDIVGPLRKWADDRSSQVEKERAHERINRLITAFCEKGPEALISPALLPTDISIEIFNIAVLSGMRFIVVLDGYDCLDCDRFSRTRFRKISGLLRKLISSKTRSGVAYLIVSRNETLAHAISAYILSTDRIAESVKLAPADFYDIVVSRIDNLIKWFDLEGRTASEQYSSEIFGAREIALAFKDAFIRRHDEGHYDELVRLFPTNTRACVQMLSAEFTSFAEEKGNFGTYRLIEMITLAGYTFPPIVYEYLLGGTDIPVCEYNKEEGRISFDTRFLPIITRPPIFTRRGKPKIAGVYSISSVMHGVRILQIISLYKSKNSKDRSSGLSIGSVKLFMQRIFGYAPEVTEFFCHELEAYGCLQIVREHWDADHHDDDGLLIMPKGEFLIESIIIDPAYLNLCAMRTVLGVSVHQQDAIQLKSPAFGIGADRHVQLGSWVSAKILNTLTMARLLFDQNQAQSRLPRPVTDDIWRKFNDNFSVVDQDFERLFGDIDKLLRKVPEQLYPIYVNLATEFGSEVRVVYASADRESIIGALARCIFEN
jgi:hypothetical protein